LREPRCVLLAGMRAILTSVVLCSVVFSRPSDPAADPAARALFANLQDLAAFGIMLGHQDATAYGVGWQGEAGRSDFKSVCGAHPAVLGWDVGSADGGTGEALLNGLTESSLRTLVQESHRRGEVQTVTWHMHELVTGGSFKDTESMRVAELLPGGTHHGLLLREVRRVARILAALTDDNGARIPLILRPYHEPNRPWFWWGTGACSDEAYRQLFRWTVCELRKTYDLHQLLIAYAPDHFVDRESYLLRYPGDDVVDVLGHDSYESLQSEEQRDALVRRLRVMVALADERDKVAALTECGEEGLPTENWFTDCLLGPILADPVARRISFVMFWRNHDAKHHYAPYAGHAAAANFVAACEQPLTLLSGQLPEMTAVPGARVEAHGAWLERALYRSVAARGKSLYPEYARHEAWLGPFDARREHARPLTVQLQPAGALGAGEFRPPDGVFERTDANPVTLFANSANPALQGELPAYVHGAVRPDQLNEITVEVDAAHGVSVELEVGEVSYVGATLGFELDGVGGESEVFSISRLERERARPVMRHQGTYSTWVPAGQHTLRIYNGGADWFQLKGIRLVPAFSAVPAHGLRGETAMLLSPEGQAAATGALSLTISDVREGEWLLEEWDQALGMVMNRRWIVSDGEIQAVVAGDGHGLRLWHESVVRSALYKAALAGAPAPFAADDGLGESLVAWRRFLDGRVMAMDRVVVRAPARGKAGELTLVPVAVGFDPDGEAGTAGIDELLTVSMREPLPAYLHPEASAGMRLELSTNAALELVLTVESVDDRGSGLRILLDGKPISETSWPVAKFATGARMRVRIPGGAHVVELACTGAGWLRWSSIRLEPADEQVMALRCDSVLAARTGLIYVENSSELAVAGALLSLPGLGSGTSREVRIWDLATAKPGSALMKLGDAEVATWVLPRVTGNLALVLTEPQKRRRRSRPR